MLKHWRKFRNKRAQFFPNQNLYSLFSNHFHPNTFIFFFKNLYSGRRNKKSVHKGLHYMIESFPSGVALIPEAFGISEKDVNHPVVKWDVEEGALGWKLE